MMLTLLLNFAKTTLPSNLFQFVHRVAVWVMQPTVDRLVLNFDTSQAAVELIQASSIMRQSTDILPVM